MPKTRAHHLWWDSYEKGLIACDVEVLKRVGWNQRHYAKLRVDVFMTISRLTGKIYPQAPDDKKMLACMRYLCEELGIPFRTWTLLGTEGFFLSRRYDPRVTGPIGLPGPFCIFSAVEFIARFISMGLYASAHYVARTLRIEKIEELEKILDTFERQSFRFRLLSASSILSFRHYLSFHHTADHDVSAECVASLGYAIGSTFTIPIGHGDTPLRGKVVAAYPPYQNCDGTSNFRMEIRWDISAFDASTVGAYVRGIGQIYTVQAMECARYRRSVRAALLVLYASNAYGLFSYRSDLVRHIFSQIGFRAARGTNHFTQLVRFDRFSKWLRSRAESTGAIRVASNVDRKISSRGMSRNRRRRQRRTDAQRGLCDSYSERMDYPLDSDSEDEGE